MQNNLGIAIDQAEKSTNNLTRNKDINIHTKAVYLNHIANCVGADYRTIISFCVCRSALIYKKYIVSNLGINFTFPYLNSNSSLHEHSIK